MSCVVFIVRLSVDTGGPCVLTTVLLLPWTWGAGISSPGEPRAGLLPVLHLLGRLQAASKVAAAAPSFSCSLPLAGTTPSSMSPPALICPITGCHWLSCPPASPAFLPTWGGKPGPESAPRAVGKGRSLDEPPPRFSGSAVCEMVCFRPASRSRDSQKTHSPGNYTLARKSRTTPRGGAQGSQAFRSGSVLSVGEVAHALGRRCRLSSASVRRT